MVKKCGGLPLAIVILGGLLATKRSRAQWEMVHTNIHAHLNNLQQQDRQYGAVNEILALSYNELPCYLKPCFLYLGHYPEDWEISKKELIQLWIAEGFISPTLEGRGMLMEDVAEEFLEELINRCLVQVRKRDHTGIGVKTCHIYDLLMDLCVDEARKENFFEIIQPLSVENYGRPPHVSLLVTMARRIAIHPSKRYVCLKGEHPNLRSLLLFQNESLIEMRISNCKNFKFLRVLKGVKRGDNDWRVSSEIGNLYHLRYLEVRCYRKIILPRSIEKLKNLHTLRAYSNIIKTPNVLFELEHLRHILLSKSFEIFGRRIMGSPQKFTSKNIITFKYIGVENLIKSNAVLSLTNIQSLGICFKRSKEVEPILRALIQLHRLRSLKMRFIGDSFLSYPNMELLSQSHQLSKLYLNGQIQADPHSSHHVLKFVPTNIVQLTLVRSKVRQDPMAVLEKLPHLRILHLWSGSYMGTKLICSANGFLQLDFLQLSYLYQLEGWEIEEGAMPRLRRLNLAEIPDLRMFPEGLRYITALQEMRLERMRRSLVERIEVIDGREGEDFSEVSHIPSIQIF